MSQPPTDHSLAVVVLAAGAGTRMRSRTPKVLHTLGGRSMLGHVLVATQELAPTHVVVVVGHGREQVAPAVHALIPDAHLAVQDVQAGTGHAVAVAVAALRESTGGVPAEVVVTTADTPLLEGVTLATMVSAHRGHRGSDGTPCAATLLTSEVPDPHGYGRVVRGADGAVRAVVEEKDADDAQARIREINAGIYVFDGPWLEDALSRVTDDNAGGEHYLTDVVGLAAQDGRQVQGHVLADVAQTRGANDRVQLADLGAELNRRTLDRWMRAGVSVVDPASTWVDVTVTLEPDTTLLPGVQLHGATTVAQDAVIGPDTTLADTAVGAGATVIRSHGTGAVIGAGATVGPYSYLRPGTDLGQEAKLGAFVESKNARLGRGAKVPHLSYVGDAEVGEGSNIGAGTIFANYDGVAKHRTTVGRHARTGSNNTFIAPVTIGDGAATGGGTVVRRDVPPGALAVSGGPQRVLEGWVLKNRAGTPSAAAATEAATEAARGRRGHGVPRVGRGRGWGPRRVTVLTRDPSYVGRRARTLQESHS